MRRFADVRAERSKAVDGYITAVRNREFPQVETESYSMDQGKWEKFLDEEGGLDFDKPLVNPRPLRDPG